MQRRLSLGTLLLLPAILAGCDGNPPWADAPPEDTQSTREDFGPSAAYERLMLFVAPGDEPTTVNAAIFDFAAVRDRGAFRRGARVRLLSDGEWTAPMDAGWEMSPMREPWRLVPHGPLSVLVGDGGKLDALTVQQDPPLRLEPGPAMGEYVPDGGTQLVLRQGRLTIGEEALVGILLDSQHGRALHEDAPAGGGLDSPDTGPDAGSSAADEGAASDPGAPRPGLEAILTDGAGFFVAFTPAGNGDLAWVNSLGQSDVRRSTRLAVTDWEAAAGDSVPTAWSVDAPDGSLTGEVRATTSDHSALSDALGVSYAAVSGWIQDREARREVVGLIRQIR